MAEQKYYYGTGKRKTAIARVRLLPGGGSVIINEKPLQEAFPDEPLREVIFQAFKVTKTLDKFSVVAKVEGGGSRGRRQQFAMALLGPWSCLMRD